MDSHDSVSIFMSFAFMGMYRENTVIQPGLSLNQIVPDVLWHKTRTSVPKIPAVMQTYTVLSSLIWKKGNFCRFADEHILQHIVPVTVLEVQVFRTQISIFAKSEKR
jgi:hypothetical protein